MANEPPVPEQAVQQEEDDGHLETVEEAREKMAAAQKAMEDGIAATDTKLAKQNDDIKNMPNFGALADLHGSLSNMSNMRKKKSVNEMASKLGVEP